MEMDRIWLVANWKMHGARARAADYAYHINAALASAPVGLHAVFCPPALFLDACARALPANARLALGAQDCHEAGEGAFTGEISAAMLAESGARYVIVGHSERRAQGNEPCARVRAKAQAACAAGLKPIICIGETQAEYEAGQTAAVLARQMTAVQPLPPGAYLVAYEPVWAIGSGKTPTPREIERAHAQVKSALGSAVDVLYGGSVKPTNIREILACDGVSGALIGGAGLTQEGMQAMIGAASAQLRK